MSAIVELWGLLGRLPPERRGVIESAYSRTRETMGDEGASAHVLTLLTSAERHPSEPAPGPAGRPRERRR